jgi:hypothetical protein
MSSLPAASIARRIPAPMQIALNCVAFPTEAVDLPAGPSPSRQNQLRTKKENSSAQLGRTLLNRNIGRFEDDNPDGTSPQEMSEDEMAGMQGPPHRYWTPHRP